MRIDPAYPPAMQPLALNNAHHFLVLRPLRLGQGLEQGKDLLPVAQNPACQLTDDERMDQHLRVLQEGLELAVSSAQVIDPDGRVNEDHATRPDRRRRIPLKPSSVPPNLAVPWALSWASRASRPMRTSAVFLETPVNRAARRMREDSMFKVVRMYAL